MLERYTDDLRKVKSIHVFVNNIDIYDEEKRNNKIINGNSYCFRK